MEVPAVERLQDRFKSAHTQVLGVSVDSIFCHANWAVSLGGISFPLLADFHPKGAVAESYGLYLEDNGITDRATVVIDADGVVCHASSVTPSGKRDIEELAELCTQIDEDYEKPLADFPTPPGVPPADLYVKPTCGFSLKVLAARVNLHLEDDLTVVDILQDEAARDNLERLAGKVQVPCLIRGETAMLESTDIIEHLVSLATDIGLG